MKFNSYFSCFFLTFISLFLNWIGELFRCSYHSAFRSNLKKWIFIQGQGGTEFQAAGILKYVEELKRGPNTEIETKDFFEIASINISGVSLIGNPVKIGDGPAAVTLPFSEFIWEKEPFWPC